MEIKQENSIVQSLVNSAFVMSIVGVALSELGLVGLIFSLIARGKVKKATAAGAELTGKLKVASILAMVALIVSIVCMVVYLIACGAGIAMGIAESM